MKIQRIRARTYDGNKNLTSDGVLSMVYDADNRMTSLSKSGLSESMVYDWMGRLIKKTVNSATTRYYYSGWTVLAEVNESGGATLHRYVHGPRIDELLTDETGGTTYHVLSDHLGSTTALVTGTSTVAQRYTYDPYGTPTIRNAAGSPITATPLTNYLYTGREYDYLSGLYNYRHRFYHPGLGRFLQPDPIGFEGGLNLQEYVSGAPLDALDPFGLSPDTIGFYDGKDKGAGGIRGWFIAKGKNFRKSTKKLTDNCHDVQSLESAADIVAAECKKNGKKFKRVIFNDHGGANGGGQDIGDAAIQPTDAALKRIAKYMTDDGVIDLKGCQVKKGAGGAAYVKELEAATGRKVEASEHYQIPTGFGIFSKKSCKK